MIMACGTGKTFTALRIAEEIAGVGGRVLYLVPSIGLFAQAMREWAEQQAIPHRYIGICSDTKAGRTDEDASLFELEFPVTTDETVISEALQTTERRTLIINEHVRLTGMPEDAHRYVVNSRSPLEWFIDRYYIKTDKDSGIVNDPNGWFDDPRNLVSAIKRIVYVSVESARIIDGLPTEINEE